MKRSWKNIFAGLALGVLASTAVADPPQSLVIAQDKQPAAAAAAPVTGQTTFDAACRSGGIEGGITGYLLRPYFQTNTAFSTETTQIGAGGFRSITTTSTDFNWDYEPAFAIWLGWTGERGFGARVRYFGFDQSSNSVNLQVQDAGGAVPGGPPVTRVIPVFGPTFLAGGGNIGTSDISLGSDLRVQTWDFEATWSHRCGNWGCTLGAGVRIIHVAQDSFAATTTTADVQGLGVVTESALNTFGHNFNGAGPTIDLDLAYTFGSSGLGLFANVRGSLLVGTERQTTTQSTLLPAAPAFERSLVTNTNRDTSLSVAEIELGVQYTRDMGRMRPFARAAVVNQTYFDAGSSTTRDGNLNLFGGQITLGVRY